MQPRWTAIYILSSTSTVLSNSPSSCCCCCWWWWKLLCSLFFFLFPISCFLLCSPPFSLVLFFCSSTGTFFAALRVCAGAALVTSVIAHPLTRFNTAIYTHAHLRRHLYIATKSTFTSTNVHLETSKRKTIPLHTCCLGFFLFPFGTLLFPCFCSLYISFWFKSSLLKPRVVASVKVAPHRGRCTFL